MLQSHSNGSSGSTLNELLNILMEINPLAEGMILWMPSSLHPPV